MERSRAIEALFVTLMASLILIVMGLVYFMVTLWIVKLGSRMAGLSPDANWVVFSASIIVVGIMMGSAIKNT